MGNRGAPKQSRFAYKSAVMCAAFLLSFFVVARVRGLCKFPRKMWLPEVPGRPRRVAAGCGARGLGEQAQDPGEDRGAVDRGIFNP